MRAQPFETRVGRIARGGLTLALVMTALGLVKTADRVLFGERLKDAWGAYRWSEDWSSAIRLNSSLDYSWLFQANRPIRIAHALGEPTTENANTEAALRRSLASDLRIVEVDLWLDDQNVLRCHHGPKPPPPLSPRDCTFDRLLSWLEQEPVWIVTDFKTDFLETGRRVMTALSHKPIARRVILQLYRPEHLEIFSDWADREPLPGPIVTAYLAQRSLSHIASQLLDLNVRAFTFPIDRARALHAHPFGLTLFVHPVHDCSSWSVARALGVGGIYTTSDILCSGGAP